MVFFVVVNVAERGDRRPDHLPQRPVRGGRRDAGAAAGGPHPRRRFSRQPPRVRSGQLRDARRAGRLIGGGERRRSKQARQGGVVFRFVDMWFRKLYHTT